MAVIIQAVGAAPITGSAGGVFNVIAGQPGAGAQLAVNLPGSGKFNGQQFKVRASGLASLAAGTYTASVQPLIYASTTVGFTAAAASAIYSNTAINVTVASGSAVLSPWTAEITIEGDTTSGKLTGYYTGSANNGVLQLVDLTNIQNPPTSVNFSTEPPLQFSAGVTLASGAIAGSVVSLTQFQITAD